MRKSNLKFGIVIGVLFIIYNLLMFVLPFEKNGMFWLSYGFTLDAFVIAVVACIIAFRSGTDIMSKFYGFPIAKVGVMYLCIQIMICFMFVIFSRKIQIWLGVLVYAVALGIAIVGLVVTDSVRDNIQCEDIKLAKEISVIRAAQSKVNQMAVQCNDSGAALAVKQFSDELRFSDPVSGSALVEIEADLTAVIDEIQQAVVDENVDSIMKLCKKATEILNERNRLCKLNK